MGELKNAYINLVTKPEEKRPFGRPSRRWKIILELILGKQSGKLWTEVIRVRIETNGLLCAR
jgi:hypothetical protein